MEPSVPFHKLVKLVDAEVITNEKIRAVDIPLEVINETSEPASHKISSEFYDLYPEDMFTQTIYPNKRGKTRILEKL